MAVDRDGFPTLVEGGTGWPVLRVPWSPDGRVVEVEVSEDNDRGDVAVVEIRAPGVEVQVLHDSGRGPWHIVSRVSGKHLGPFSTALDCALARSVAGPEWVSGTDMDRVAFARHMAGGSGGE